MPRNLVSRMLLDKPVRIKVPGDVETVVTIQQAGHRLLEWPAGKVDTAKHVAARKAVLKALQAHYGHGFREKVAARKALEAAAEEAGILEPKR